MKIGKSGGDDGVSLDVLKYLPPSGIREMTKIIHSTWIGKRSYRGISLLGAMYKVLEWIILGPLIEHRSETVASWFRPD
ncbi:hypothetical protein RB195_023543 [Necator americanus]|uniref:Uncharacterized protein n=1 Tax=Necator americanus TaxID=51031 RepID=A0ABR1EJL8_NECAM